MTNQMGDREEADSVGKSFCRVGGACALIAGSFAMLQTHTFSGIIDQARERAF